MNNAKILNIVIIVFLVCIIAGSLIFGADHANTITAVLETAESVVDGSGIVTVYGRLITANESGHVLYSVEEGKLIKKYTTIASVYSGEISDEMSEKLKLLNDKIAFSKSTEQYKNEVFNDIGSVNNEINNQFSRIISDTQTGDYSNVYNLKSRIITYHEKALKMKGETVAAPASESDSTQSLRLEQELHVEKSVYTSPVDGMFSPRVDNFDKLLTPDTAVTLTPKSYKNLMKNDVKQEREIAKDVPFAKIINNFEWYLVSSLPSSEISDIEVGSNVDIVVKSVSDSKVNGQVIYISEEESKEKVIVIKSTKLVEGIYTADKVEFEIIKKSYKGLKIPTSSIIKKEGKEGVYTIKEGVYKFAEVEVIFRDKNYVLIKDKSSGLESDGYNVILYDLVVSNPEKVKEGAIAGGAM